MKYGARNQLKGKVVDIKKGDVMCQVRLEIADGATMNSVSVGRAIPIAMRRKPSPMTSPACITSV